MYMYSYCNKSESARSVANALGIKMMINHENSKFVGSPDKVVLNWGSSDLPREVRYCKVINSEFGVSQAVNKLKTFKALTRANVPTPAYTTDRNVAIQWTEGSLTPVFCRGNLVGHDGDGIHLAFKPNEVIYAPLYTSFLSAWEEYRITVFKDHAILCQRKVKRKDVQQHSPYLRTTAGGYGFDVDRAPKPVQDAAVAAIKALGLDFGGVDIILHDETLYPHVLEVNTAPQLTPYALEKLSKAIREEYLGDE